MKIVDRLFKNKSGMILISIIWGLGLAALFKKVCKGRNCVIVKSPLPKDVENSIYKFDNKCYTFETENTFCTKKKINNNTRKK